MKHGCDRSTCMEDLSRVCCLSDNIKASDRRASIATRGAFNRHLMKFEVLNVFFFLFCKCTENGEISALEGRSAASRRGLKKKQTTTLGSFYL